MKKGNGWLIGLIISAILAFIGCIFFDLGILPVTASVLIGGGSTAVIITFWFMIFAKVWN